MGTRDEYVKTIKSIFAFASVKSAMGVIVDVVPVFANPFFYTIIEHLIESGIAKILDRGEAAVFMIYIDLRTTSQGRALFQAASNWQKIKTDPKSTPEEIQRAEDEKVRKFAEFAVWRRA